MEAPPAAADGLEAVAPNSLAMNPFTLAFKSAAIEAEYLCDVAKRRWPVLIFIFCFDVACFLFRFIAKLYSSRPLKGSSALDIVFEMGHQLTNMVMLYVLIGLLNKRARKTGSNAARQEEVLLSACMALAICNLLASLRADNGQDYVYMAYFLICTSSFLKIRWWVGTGVLASPTVAVHVWYGRGGSILPPDAVVHIVVAWAVGGLMTYLADWYRRQTFANQKLALAAHEKELLEARARMQAQRELAAAQAQAAQRALSVAREKAAHEAKNEFMSLMCHEVRTPLNGCLASAEMLLETPLAEEQRELAKTIRVSGSILLSTVSNFLDFFKLEAGKQLDIVRTLVSLPELVGDVHCIIEAMVGRGGSLALRPPLLPGDLALVYCDPDRLRGILLNLYTNAAKFTKCGSISLRVRVVEADYEPEPPPGWAGITITPSYCTRPSTDVSRVSWSRDSVDQGLRKLFGSSGNLLSPAPSSCNLLATAAAAGAQLNDHNSSSGGGGAAGSGGGATPAAAASAASTGGGNVEGDSSSGGGEGKAARRSSGQVVHLVAEPAAPRRSFSAPSLHRSGQPHQPSPLSTSSTPLQAAAGGSDAAEAGGPLAATTVAAEAPNSATTTSSSSSSTWGWPPQSFAKGLRHRLAAAAAARSHWRLGGGRDSQEVSHLQAAAAAAAAAGSGYPRAAAAAAAAGAGGGGSPEGVAGGTSALPPLPPPRLEDAPNASAAASTSGRPSLGIPGGVRSNALPGGAAAAGRVRWLLFEVMDTGVGITEDALQTLFREYVQGTDAEMAKPRATGGTGLGLSICSKQVGVLGGCIGAQSATGVGSTFWFKIPVIAGDMEPYRMAASSSGMDAAGAAPTEAQGAATHSSAGAAPIAPTATSSSNNSRASLTHWGPGRKGIRWQWQQGGLPPGAPKGPAATASGQQPAAAAAAAAGPSSAAGSPDSGSAVEQMQAAAAAVAGVSGSSKGQGEPGGCDGANCTEGAAYIRAGPPAPPPSSTLSSGTAGGNSNRSSWENSGQPATDTSSSSSSRGSDGSAAAEAGAGTSGGGGAGGPVGSLGYRPAPPSVCDPASSSLYALESPLPPRLQQAGGGPGVGRQPPGHLGGTGSSSSSSSSPSYGSPVAAAAPPGASHPSMGGTPAAAGLAHLLPSQPSSSSNVPPLPTGAGHTAAAAAPPAPTAAAVARPTGVSFDGRRSVQLDTSCLAGKRVLLAEDNLINQTVARKMLSSLGMSVEVAVNGLEALNAVQRTTGEGGGVTSSGTGSPGDPGFDIILMDMAMPVMGGVEATRAIRAAGHRLPIVAMTANASDKDRDECAESGMDGFLSKPVLREQLARALLAVLGPGAAAPHPLYL